MMGYIRHDAVVAVVSDYGEAIQRIADFKASLPEPFDKLLTEPVVGVNGYTAYCFLPDGSKEGWEHSDTAQEYREAFAKIAAAAGDVVYVSFGGDFKYDVGPAMVRDVGGSEPSGGEERQ